MIRITNRLKAWAIAAALMCLAVPAGAAVPAPWNEMGIGAVGPAGSGSVSGGTWTVKGSGADIWGTADAFHYVYQRLNGNAQIVARVTSLANTHAWAKAGLMIREDLTPGSRHAFICMTPSNGVSFQSRATTGGTSTSATTAGVVAPRWIKLGRSGDNLTAWHSADGVAWTLVGTTRVIAMQPVIHVGFAITSHNNAQLGTATFTGFQVQAPPVLLVAGSTLLNASDAAVKKRLENLGYAVAVKAGSASVAADANGKDLVVISSTVNSGDVNSKFRDVAVPVLTWENAIYDDMKMTGTVSGADFGTTPGLTTLGIDATACDRATMYTAAKGWGDGCHDLAAGLAGNSLSVTRSNQAVSWGKPAAAAVRIAYPTSNSALAAVFGYEKGAAMVGLAAPARRVGFFYSDNSAASLQGRGQALFDAAVYWATGTRYSITKKLLVINFDPILENKGGVRIHEWGRNRSGWWGGDPWPILRNYLADLTEASGGYLKWKLVKYADIPDYIDRWTPITGSEQFDSPTFSEQEFTDAYEYALDTWDWAGAGRRMPSDGSYRMDYHRILDEYGVDARVNAGEVDEVIVPNHPFSGAWESAMAGNTPYAVNGDVYYRNTSKNYMVMNLSYERGLSEVLENFGHRTEWMVSRAFFGFQNTQSYDRCYYVDWNRENENPPPCGGSRQVPVLQNVYDRFGMVEGILPGEAAIGAVHWAPNATSHADEYVWNKDNYVWSMADDWMFNYPRLAGASTKRQVNLTEWLPMAQDGDAGRGFKKWWYFHMPRVAGVLPASTAYPMDSYKLNNWWEYIANFNRHPESDN